jgi:hypothetical protein
MGTGIQTEAELSFSYRSRPACQSQETCNPEALLPQFGINASTTDMSTLIQMNPLSMSIHPCHPSAYTAKRDLRKHYSSKTHIPFCHILWKSGPSSSSLRKTICIQNKGGQICTFEWSAYFKVSSRKEATAAPERSFEGPKLTPKAFVRALQLTTLSVTQCHHSLCHPHLLNIILDVHSACSPGIRRTAY